MRKIWTHVLEFSSAILSTDLRKTTSNLFTKCQGWIWNNPLLRFIDAKTELVLTHATRKEVVEAEQTNKSELYDHLKSNHTNGLTVVMIERMPPASLCKIAQIL